MAESSGRGIPIAAAFLTIVVGIKAAESIVVPFLLPAFMAIIAAPPMFWLEKHHIPQWLALLLGRSDAPEPTGEPKS